MFLITIEPFKVGSPGIFQSSIGCLQPLHFGSSSGDALGFGFAVSVSRQATQVRAPSMRQKLPTMGFSQWVHLKHSGCQTRPGKQLFGAGGCMLMPS